MRARIDFSNVLFVIERWPGADLGLSDHSSPSHRLHKALLKKTSGGGKGPLFDGHECPPGVRIAVLSLLAGSAW